MSKIKNGGLDQYGAKPFEQQQFRTPGVERVKVSDTHYSGQFCDFQLASKLHNWCIHVIVLLLGICDISNQVIFQMLIYFLGYFHLRMHRNRMAAGLCDPRPPS